MRLVWIAGFVIGARNHAADVLGRGWLPYDYAPLALNWFWTMLLPLDVLVGALLALRQRAGVVLGVIVILADVAVNSWYAYRTDWLDLFRALQWQSLFCGFVIGTAPYLWQRQTERLTQDR